MPLHGGQATSAQVCRNQLAQCVSFSPQGSTGTMCQLLNVQESKHNCKINGIEEWQRNQSVGKPLSGRTEYSFAGPSLSSEQGKVMGQLC
jgi:hypothetical protein